MAKDVTILRKWGNGDIIALFPDKPGDTRGIFCDSYEHVGQHGSAEPMGVIGMTKPVKRTDPKAKVLIAELKRIGYDPLIHDRYIAEFGKRRHEAARKLRNERA